jgi:hypothetical protein
MAKRNKNRKKTYRYECTLTGDTFKRTAETKSVDDLVSVAAYYELNPEEDDRPDVIKKELGILEQE